MDNSETVVPYQFLKTRVIRVKTASAELNKLMRGRSSSVCFVLGNLQIIFNRGTLCRYSSLISRRKGTVASSDTDSFEMEKAARILSVQSHTTHGYVGNKAATFPLQTMGYDVNCINTVSLSNHPAYKGGCKGSSLQLQDLTAFIEGLENNDLLNYNAVITGYISKPELLDAMSTVIGKIKDKNSAAQYLCDPVLGDNGRYYVPECLKDVYKERLLPLATIITPNLFEAEVLSGRTIRSFNDAVEACKVLHAMGPKISFLTGLNLSQDDSVLSILVSYYGNSADSGLQLKNQNSDLNDDNLHVIRVDFPKVARSFSGCGDLFSALVSACIHRCREAVSTQPQQMLGYILEIVTRAMTTVLQRTAALESSELCIIESRDIFQQLLDDSNKLLSFPPVVPPYETTYTPISYIAAHPTVIGIIFDMDGTLTEPGAIDFLAMYHRNGLVRSATSDILTEISKLPTEEQRQAAMAIIEEEERLGWQRMKPRSNLTLLLKSLQSARIRTALATRNTKESFQIFTEKAGLESAADDALLLKPAIFRDSLNGINKPDAQVAEHIMAQWDILPSQRDRVWFVGDSKDDMLCGRAAGCRTCLIRTDYNRDYPSDLVDLEVDDLIELAAKLNIPGFII